MPEALFWLCLLLPDLLSAITLCAPTGLNAGDLVKMYGVLKLTGNSKVPQGPIALPALLDPGANSSRDQLGRRSRSPAERSTSAAANAPPPCPAPPRSPTGRPWLHFA